MVGLMIIWADVIFDNIYKHHSIFPPYSAFLAFIFKKFKVDFKNEMNVVSHFKLFDYTVLLRMKIPSVVGQSDAGISISTPHDTQTQEQPSTQPQETHAPPPPSYGDAYYNCLC